MTNKKANKILILYILIIILALLLRVLALDLRPLHHDEGVNGHFMLQLSRNGFYRYNPENYHGPLLYYITLPFFALFKESIFSMRLVTALFGVGLILLLLPLRKHLGDTSFLISSLFIAISPTLVFYSRYFIHEILFLFFTLAAIVSFLCLRKNPDCIYFFFLSIVLLLATKETSFVILFFFLIFFIILSLNKRVRNEEIDFIKKNKNKILLAFFLSLFLLVVLYTSFFTNPRGIIDFLSAPFNWLKTGVSGTGHEKPFYYFFKLLLLYEPIFLIGSFIFILTALFIKPIKKELKKSKFKVFVLFWFVIVLLFYSIIPYKTPWLSVNIILPLIILSSFLFEKVLYDRPKLFFFFFVMALVLIFSILTNFIFYENEQNMLAYVQTKSDVNHLVNLVSMFPGKINIVLSNSDYWPLPFYLKDFDVVYSEPPISQYKDICDYDIVITRSSIKKLCDFDVSYFSLRPGVDLAVFYRCCLHN